LAGDAYDANDPTATLSEPLLTYFVGAGGSMGGTFREMKNGQYNPLDYR
jgi:hypothetical protein